MSDEQETVQNQKTILFVDNERNILSAIRRSLRKEEWNLITATSAHEGLQVLQDQPVDLVVSDMRMPEMDGAAFLKQVKDLYPETIRIVLTGYSERESVSRAFAEADIREMISKPWDDEELKLILRNALSQSELQEAQSPGLHEIINKIESLPTVPRVYARIRDVIEHSEEVSATQIADVIVQDPAMAAKILQIANSAFFGQRRGIDTVSRAIVVVGMEMIETLVLSAGVFQIFETEPIEGFSQDDLWRHSLACGLIAKHLTESISRESKRQETAMLAGTLHDLGKLVLAQYMHDEYVEVVRTAVERRLPIVDIEQEILGATHAEIGGYLADWWNLPPNIVDAIRWHYNPSGSQHDSKLAFLVHIADFLVHSLEVGASSTGSSPGMDPSAFQRLGISASPNSIQRELRLMLEDIDFMDIRAH